MPMPIQVAHTLARRLAEVRNRERSTTCATTARRRSRSATATVPVAIEKILIRPSMPRASTPNRRSKPDLWQHVVEPVLSGEFAELFDPESPARGVLVKPDRGSS